MVSLPEVQLKQPYLYFCETQISKTNNLKVTIGELKFVSRTIPQSGGFNTPQRAFEFVSKACFGVSYP